MHLQQFLLQAVHPTSSQLLQLPHVSPEIVAKAHQQGIETIKDFARLPSERVDSLLNGFIGGTEMNDVVEVAKHWPVVDFVDAKFQGQQPIFPRVVDVDD
jgi:translocation protein SEC63